MKASVIQAPHILATVEHGRRFNAAQFSSAEQFKEFIATSPMEVASLRELESKRLSNIDDIVRKTSSVLIGAGVCTRTF
jgi:hypothetical protein